MKPTPQFNESKSRSGLTTRSSRRIISAPITDYNFQASSVEGFKSRGGKSCLSSFRNISSDYFENEARQAFAGESAFFAVIVATVAVPLIHSMGALLQLVRSIGAL